MKTKPLDFPPFEIGRTYFCCATVVKGDQAWQDWRLVGPLPSDQEYRVGVEVLVDQVCDTADQVKPAPPGSVRVSVARLPEHVVPEQFEIVVERK